MVQAAPAVDARPSRLRRTLAASFGTSLAIQGLNVVTGVLLARALGPQGRGELAAVMLWPSLFATLGALGVADATAFYAARDSADRGTLVGSTLVVGVFQSVLLVGAAALAIPFVLSGYDREAVHAAYLFLAFIPLTLLALHLMYALNGFHRFGWFQLLRLLAVAPVAAGLVALALAGSLRVTTAVPVYLAANLVAGLVAAAALVRTGLGRRRSSTALARQLLGYGVRSHLSTVAGSLNERLDQLVISVFLAPARLGLYVVAVTFTSATSLIGASVSYIALPAIAREPDGARRAAAARRFTVLTLLASVAIALPLLAFTPALLGLLFGDAFRSVTGVARLLLVAAVVLSVNRALGAILKGAGRPLDAGVAEAVALLATVGGLAVLLPALGLMGAAVASLVAYTVSTAWMAARAARGLGVPVSDLLVPRLADLRLALHPAQAPSVSPHRLPEEGERL